MRWESLKGRNSIKLYAGDIPPTHPQVKTHVGLSLTQDNENHILHNIENPLPIPDNSVAVYQSEDVLEHLETKWVIPLIDEIYRVLEPGGLFRLSVPDYRCNVLSDRSVWKDEKIIFDPGGGGELVYDASGKPKVIRGGHMWFPMYEGVKWFINRSMFAARNAADLAKEDLTIDRSRETMMALAPELWGYECTRNYLHYYTEEESVLGVTNPIDYSLGYIQRTPDHDLRVSMPYRPMSIVVDLYKGKGEE